jgi:hypothetical protein
LAAASFVLSVKGKNI